MSQSSRSTHLPSFTTNGSKGRQHQSLAYKARPRREESIPQFPPTCHRCHTEIQRANQIDELEERVHRMETRMMVYEGRFTEERLEALINEKMKQQYMELYRTIIGMKEDFERYEERLYNSTHDRHPTQWQSSTEEMPFDRSDEGLA